MADKIMGKEWMAFTKITMDSYHNCTLVGQIKALADLQNNISVKIKELQEIYEKTETGRALKKANEAALKEGATTDNLPPRKSDG